MKILHSKPDFYTEGAAAVGVGLRSNGGVALMQRINRGETPSDRSGAAAVGVGLGSNGGVALMQRKGR